MNATLFGVCPLPVCSNPVDDGEPCAECTGLIDEGLIREVAAPEPRSRRPGGSPPLAGIPASMVPVSAREYDLLGAEATTAEEWARIPRAERMRTPHPGLPVIAEWKPGQHCWVCEQRRTCRPDPELAGQWICKECEAAQ